MLSAITQHTWLPVIQLSLLVFLLLGETFLIWPLLTVFTLLLLVHAPLLSWRRATGYKMLVAGWLALLGWLLLTLIYSHSLPLSALAIAKFAVSFEVFWFLLLLDPKYRNSSSVVYGLITLGLVLIGISGFFFIQPVAASLLPGMNVVFSSFGHNHLAAIILTLLPLCWWWLFQAKGRLTLFASAALGVMYVSLILSFGRVALFLSFIQLSIIFLIFRRRVFTSRHIKSLIIVVTVAVLGGLLSFAWFSTRSDTTGQQHCPVERFQQQLCKPLLSNPRLQYWQQAIEATRDYPVFGYGLGTFNLINTKYRQSLSVTTSFAHNSYLEMAAETGLVGGSLFALVMVLPMLQMACSLRKNFTKRKNHLVALILLSLGSIYVNALFDFDWNFLGTYVLTIVVLTFGYTLANPRKKHSDSRGWTVRLMQLTWSTIAVFLVIGGSLFVASDSLLSSGHVSQAFAVGPFFLQNKELFLVSDGLKDEQQKQLRSLYRYHPDVWREELSKAQTLKEQNIVLERLFVVDPMAQKFHLNLSELVAAGKVDLANRRLRAVLDFYLDHPRLLEHDTRVTIADAAASLADIYVADQNLRLAAQTYDVAHAFDHTLFERHEFDWLDSAGLSSNQKWQLLRSLRFIAGSDFGKNSQDIAEAHLKLLLKRIGQTKQPNIVEVSDRIIDITDWMWYQTWSQVSQKYNDQVIQALKLQQLHTAAELLDEWYALRNHWQDLPLPSTDILSLVTLLIEVENAAASDGVVLDQQLLVWAVNLNPEAALQSDLWFTSGDFADISNKVTMRTARQATAIEEQHSLNGTVFNNLYLEAIQILAHQGKVEELWSIAQVYNQHQTTYQQEQASIVALQQTADNLVKTENYSAAQVVLDVMVSLEPSDYWLVTQPAHLMLLQGDYVGARKRFQSCLEQFKFQHTDCQRGKQELPVDNSSSDRYWQVSQIIRGEAVWQDFVTE